MLLGSDGLINVKHGYVDHSENFEFNDGVVEVARAGNTRGYKPVVFTNW